MSPEQLAQLKLEMTQQIGCLSYSDQIRAWGRAYIWVTYVHYINLSSNDDSWEALYRYILSMHRQILEGANK